MKLSGYKADIDEVDLIQKFNTLVLCLQKTYVTDHADVNILFFGKYSFYNKIGSVIENKVSGGVTIMVIKSVPHSEIRLNTRLQAVAIRVSIQNTITLCLTLWTP